MEREGKRKTVKGLGGRTREVEERKSEREKG